MRPPLGWGINLMLYQIGEESYLCARNEGGQLPHHVMKALMRATFLLSSMLFWNMVGALLLLPALAYFLLPAGTRKAQVVELAPEHPAGTAPAEPVARVAHG